MQTSTTRKITLSLSLLGVGLCAGLAALAGASSATAGGLLRGDYIVAASTNVPAPLYIEVTASNGEQMSTQTIACVLPNAADSLNVFCTQHQIALPVTKLEMRPYETVIEVDFLPLEAWAVDHGITVLEIDPAEPTSYPAEGVFDTDLGRWVCETSDADQARCDTNCGIGGGSVSAKPTIPSNNPMAEPSCKVTCDCRNNNNNDTTWIDPPEVTPAF